MRLRYTRFPTRAARIPALMTTHSFIWPEQFRVGVGEGESGSREGVDQNTSQATHFFFLIQQREKLASCECLIKAP